MNPEDPAIKRRMRNISSEGAAELREWRGSPDSYTWKEWLQIAAAALVAALSLTGLVTWMEALGLT